MSDLIPSPNYEFNTIKPEVGRFNLPPVIENPEFTIHILRQILVFIEIQKFNGSRFGANWELCFSLKVNIENLIKYLEMFVEKRNGLGC